MKLRHRLLAGTAGLLMCALAPTAYADSGMATIDCGDDSPNDTVTYSPTILWPPNHKLRTIDITGHDTDTEKNLTITVTDIESDQTEDHGEGCGQPDPKQGADSSGVGNSGGPATDPATSVELRAERCAKLGARTYTITVSCTEEGESSTAHLVVTVPKRQ